MSTGSVLRGTSSYAPTESTFAPSSPADIIDASAPQYRLQERPPNTLDREDRLVRFIIRNTAILLTISAIVDIFYVKGNVLFAWHPAFMTLGFVGLMSEAVLLAFAFRTLEGSSLSGLGQSGKTR
jgi:hypothetical protein